MIPKQAKQYQEAAIEKLLTRTKELLHGKKDKRTIVFQAPTGSGKTFMVSRYIEQLIAEMQEEDLCFLWLSPGKGSLHKQSFDVLKKEFRGFPLTYLLEEEFFGSRRVIGKNEVVVGNWEKLSSKDGKTGEWKNVLMRDKETVNFRELVQKTKEAGVKIILIIDESHSRDKAERAFELRDEIINPELTIEMSATPVLKEGKYDEKVTVQSSDVIDEGMIKKEIIVNENIDHIIDDEITSQELIMEAAWQKRLEIKKQYESEGVCINPLVLVQIPDSEAGSDKKEFVESFLASKDITYDNHKLAVWLSEEKINQEKEFVTPNESDVEFLIFKQAIDTGWDCPRAQILVRFREIKSLVFEIQTVGRILRMPEAKHYNSDDLNRAYVYTNVKSLEVKKENDPNLNIIKSIFVKREDKYDKLKLKSYYRNRIDFGDITASFYGSLESVLCDYFSIAQGKLEFRFAEKNKKIVSKKIVIDDLEGRDEIILNKEIDAKLFDHLDHEKIKSSENYQAFLSQDDKERVFENLIKINLNGFAPKRSIPIVKNSLYRWFKKYLGINLIGGGIIYIQNIVLNNAEEFEKLFDNAICEYKPIKEKEKKKKIEEIEQWNEEWEIAGSRNYNPNTYKPYTSKLSIYKSPKDGKAYLNFDSKIEEEFIDFLEKNESKISWWWQNGNEHMEMNFGIKYGDGSTFQPDFLVKFKDGKIGIFDTKAIGYNEDDNKLKAEALQKYVGKENTKKKKMSLFGGLVVKYGNQFRINSDENYTPFGMLEKISDRSEEYGDNGEKQRGWTHLEF
ncbi:MAG: DEAD/DEAH box helicase family protein [Candidatus Moranbacteria bacterium]|nr:DEAD/DEAH box helicase family protein [Candidatus Moranbacteria bacterium]